MQYVMLVEVPEQWLDGDDSIENATRVVNMQLRVSPTPSSLEVNVRPLSEVLAC